MQPDAEHLHHRLRKRGLSQYQVAVLLYVFNGLLVLTGLLSMVFRDQALGIFLVAFVAGAYVVMRHLAEVELWDTGRAIIQGLHRPQQRVAGVPVSIRLFDVLLPHAVPRHGHGRGASTRPATRCRLGKPGLPPFRCGWARSFLPSA
jgi:hypothetical protein